MARSRPVSFPAVDASPKTLLLAVEAAAQGQQYVALVHGVRWMGALLLAIAGGPLPPASGTERAGTAT